MKYLLELGASPHKLVLGVEFAGWSFTLADRNLHEILWNYLILSSPSNGTGLKGPYTETEGYLGYNEVRWDYLQNSNTRDSLQIN